MISCDWCGNGMRRIGTVETGMLVGHASVWLCHCGHESEVFDTRLQLGYWRNSLLLAMTRRMRGLLYAEGLFLDWERAQ